MPFIMPFFHTFKTKTIKLITCLDSQTIRVRELERLLTYSSYIIILTCVAVNDHNGESVIVYLVFIDTLGTSDFRNYPVYTRLCVIESRKIKFIDRVRSVRINNISTILNIGA
ncbi:MAG: hypothetical protein BWZ04_02128 [Firmicutes bacterium ADurb.BinA205]|nr:MAG: hypothetical protein BWZ04_02128 [Firmicutes bacterium ADurb.BinA205]